LRRDAKSNNHAASNSLNEFLFHRAGKRWTFVTKDARERVRDAISHIVDALLTADEFLLNFK
jgi:hypothetical protein